MRFIVYNLFYASVACFFRFVAVQYAACAVSSSTRWTNRLTLYSWRSIPSGMPVYVVLISVSSYRQRAAETNGRISPTLISKPIFSASSFTSSKLSSMEPSPFAEVVGEFSKCQSNGPRLIHTPSSSSKSYIIRKKRAIFRACHQLLGSDLIYASLKETHAINEETGDNRCPFAFLSVRSVRCRSV